jgi:hypothetical protein
MPEAAKAFPSLLQVSQESKALRISLRCEPAAVHMTGTHPPANGPIP